MNFERGFCILVILLMGVAGSLGQTWAGRGWYLLNPPFKGATKTSFAEGCGEKRCEPDPTAPLREWRHYRSYNTANECETEKKARTQYEAGELNKAQAELKSSTNAEDRVWKDGIAKTSFGIWIRWQKSLCIASDDPRLK